MSALAYELPFRAKQIADCDGQKSAKNGRLVGFQRMSAIQGKAAGSHDRTELPGMWPTTDIRDPTHYYCLQTFTARKLIGMEDSPLAFAVTRGGDNISSNTDRLVPWWSIMKSVLAAATLRLADQGRLQLDAHFKNRPFTIRQLLQHTAGVRDYSGRPYRDAVANGEPAWTVEELLFCVNAEKLDFVPGNRWSYSNVGYLFIRQLIEETLDTDIGLALKAIVSTLWK